MLFKLRNTIIESLFVSKTQTYCSSVESLTALRSVFCLPRYMLRIYGVEKQSHEVEQTFLTAPHSQQLFVKVDTRSKAGRREDPANIQCKHADYRKERLVQRWERDIRYLGKLEGRNNKQMSSYGEHGQGFRGYDVTYSDMVNVCKKRVTILVTYVIERHIVNH